MAERRPQPSDELLSAYHDGELEAAETLEVAAALAASPELRLRSASLRALKLCVSRALDVPTPTRLEARLAAQLDAIDGELAQTPAPARPQRVAEPRSAPRRGWLTPSRVAAVAAVLALALLPLTLHGRPQWDFQPAALARNHTYWQGQFQATSASQVISPAEEASRLAQVVHYAVAAPNTEALGARLVGCTACKGSFPTHKPVAVFVMRRGDDSDMTLFELNAPTSTVTQHGFEPLDGRDVKVASAEGVNLALWSADNLHLCLTSSRSAVRELADLVPRALGGCRPMAEGPRQDFGLQLVSSDR